VALALAFALAFIAFSALNAARVVLTLYALTLGAPAAAVGVLGGMSISFRCCSRGRSARWPTASGRDVCFSRAH